MKKRIASIFATKTRAEWTTIFAGQFALIYWTKTNQKKPGPTGI